MSDRMYDAPTDEQIELEISDLLWQLGYYGHGTTMTLDERTAHRDRMAARIAEQLPLRITRMVREQWTQS